MPRMMLVLSPMPPLRPLAADVIAVVVMSGVVPSTPPIDAAVLRAETPMPWSVFSS